MMVVPHICTSNSSSLTQALVLPKTMIWIAIEFVVLRRQYTLNFNTILTHNPLAV